MQSVSFAQRSGQAHLGACLATCEMVQCCCCALCSTSSTRCGRQGPGSSGAGNHLLTAAAPASEQAWGTGICQSHGQPSEHTFALHIPRLVDAHPGQPGCVQCVPHPLQCQLMPARQGIHLPNAPGGQLPVASLTKPHCYRSHCPDITTRLKQALPRA